MRSPDLRRRTAAAALALTGLLFAALAAWTMGARSTIPTALHGTVTGVEVREEKHPGVDDVWMVYVDDARPTHVDAAVASPLGVGDRVTKDRWDSTLHVDGEPQDLELSDDAQAMMVLAPALGLVMTVLALAAGGQRRRRS